MCLTFPNYFCQFSSISFLSFKSGSENSTQCMKINADFKCYFHLKMQGDQVFEEINQNTK